MTDLDHPKTDIFRLSNQKAEKWIYSKYTKNTKLYPKTTICRLGSQWGLGAQVLSKPSEQQPVVILLEISISTHVLS
jgi:hypothetical protein